jgi:hypothetical protein
MLRNKKLNKLFHHITVDHLKKLKDIFLKSLDKISYPKEKDIFHLTSINLIKLPLLVSLIQI